MIAAELRGGSKPSLNEALAWIGSRVDDIYGANVGRLEDVWIDPGTGVPRWFLVKEGRFGGRTTLIPFEDATAGAGHVWVPYEREIVREAPEIEPGAPLTQQVEEALRAHYTANAPAAISHRGEAASGVGTRVPQPGSAMGTATIRFASGPPEPEPPSAFEPRAQETPASSPQPAYAPPRRYVLRERPQEQPPRGTSAPFHYDAPRNYAAQLPERPPPPIAAPAAGLPQQERGMPPPVPQRPAAPQAWPPEAFVPQPAFDPYQQPQQQQPMRPPPPMQQPQHPSAQVRGQAQSMPQPDPTRYWQPQAVPPPPPPAPGPVEALQALAAAGGSHYVEIELSGELTIRGELRTIRVTPRGEGPPR